MKRTLLIIFLLITTWSYSTAQTPQADPIDEELRECMEDNPSTYGMRNCTSVATEQWDAELNKVYKILMAGLSPEGQTALRESQREWIRYRDKEFAFIYQFYHSELEGTMWHSIADSDKMEIVKRRVLELRNYADLLEMK